MDNIFREFQWYQKETLDIKETIIRQTTPMAFRFTKSGSLFIHILHSMVCFVRNLFQKACYQAKNIGFVGD